MISIRNKSICRAFIVTALLFSDNHFLQAQNCGIGTIIPQSKLEIKGAGNTSASSSFGVKNSSAGSDSLMFIIKDDGSTGIGTNAPTSRLHTVASGAKTANYTGSSLSNSATSSTASITKYGLDVQSTGTWNGTSAVNIGLNVNASGGTTNYAALLSGGNVGVGTTAPILPISVMSNASTAAVYLKSTGANDACSILPWTGVTYISSGIYYKGASWIHDSYNTYNALLGIQPNTGAVWFDSNNSTGSWNVANNVTLWDLNGYWKGPVQSSASGTSYFSGGSVGINTTSPAKKLEILDNAAAQLRLTYTGGSVYTDMATTSAGYLSINPTGTRVGIGTSSPASQLHVQGAETVYSGVNTTIGSSVGLLIGDDGSNGGTGNLYQIGFHCCKTHIPSAIIAGVVADGSNYSRAELIFCTRSVTTNTVPTERMRVIGTGEVGIGTNAPKSTLHVSGSVGIKSVSKTGAYTAAGEGVILCDATSASFTITLPAASGVTDRMYIIKKTDSSGNTITIDGNASETIDGATTKVLSTQYEKVIIICNGSNWFILN